jgi:hypothetical protein
VTAFLIWRVITTPGSAGPVVTSVTGFVNTAGHDAAGFITPV